MIQNQIDMEKVIKALEHCSEDGCEGCPYEPDCLMADGFSELAKDALELLKEQEPIKPTVSVDTWICSKCGHTLESQELIDDKENPQVLVHEQYEYCPCCGRKVKWDVSM